MNHDEAIRQLTATTEHLRNARGGMRLIRDEEEVRGIRSDESRIHDWRPVEGICGEVRARCVCCGANESAMTLQRNPACPGEPSEVHALMLSAIESTSYALDEVQTALEILRAAVRAEA